jgi:excisionase family DNA binding protein
MGVQETSPSSTSEYIPVPEVARRLSVNANHVVRLIEAGELEAVDVAIGKRKRCFRVGVASLENFLAGRRVQRAAAPALTRRPPLPPGVQRICG